MKKLLTAIFLSLFLGTKIYAEINWPKFIVKEIPLPLLKTYENQSTGLDGFNDLLKQFDLNDARNKKMIMKTLVQTMKFDLEMGKLTVSDEQQNLLKKLLKKYNK